MQIRPLFYRKRLNSIKCGVWEIYLEGERIRAQVPPASWLLNHPTLAFGYEDAPWGDSSPLVSHQALTFSASHIFPDGFLTIGTEASNGNPCSPLLRAALVGTTIIIQLPNSIYLS